jgi:hypothetical protein
MTVASEPLTSQFLDRAATKVGPSLQVDPMLRDTFLAGAVDPDDKRVAPLRRAVDQHVARFIADVYYPRLLNHTSKLVKCKSLKEPKHPVDDGRDG